jgi:hypothetical protein
MPDYAYAVPQAVLKSDQNVETQKLTDLVSDTSQALFVCHTVFPFDLFPDTVTIDRNKITISKHFFFFQRSIQSIIITDLLTIVVEETLLFASLTIVDRLFHQDTIKVANLKKSDARKIRWLLEGLIIGKKEKIDLTKIPDKELIPKLIEVGKTKSR